MSGDPVESLGPLCITLVLGFLPPRDLARCSNVSRSWKAKTQELEGQLWNAHVQDLWAGKVHVAADLRQLAQSNPRRAYAESLRDATRDLITEQELCHFSWKLCFKAVGWFSDALGRLTVHRYYNPNHTVTAPPDDPLWGGAAPPRHYWFFRPGPDGATVLQVNTYPYLHCRRTEDWGFILENPVVRLTIDLAAGPNPGIAADDPAALEVLSLEQIEALFSALMLQGDGMDLDESESEEQEEGGEREEGSEKDEGSDDGDAASAGSALSDNGDHSCAI